MDLASFGLAKVEVFLLVLARTAGIFTLVPIFGAKQTPVQVRICVALGLALVFLPLCSPGVAGPLAVDLLPMALLLIREAIVGIVIGFVTLMVFAAIQAAGDLVDVHSGFSIATVFDPVSGSATAVAGLFNYMVAGMLFFATNTHHIVLSGLADSFRLFPIGRMGLNPAVVGGVVDLVAVFFVIALRIAAPVVAAVFLAEVALAIIARVVPQMNVFMVGMPLKLGIGLAGMAIALPVTVALMRNAFGDIARQTAWLLRILAS